jgi:hypothetical protein
MSNYDTVEEDARISYQVTCVDAAGTPIDLTGGSAVLRWKHLNDAAVEQAMTIDDAANGIVSYEFQAGELLSPAMELEVTVTLPTGVIMTSTELMRLAVRARLS